MSSRKPTKSLIEHANSMTKSCAGAARWLDVSYNTYKKYAKMYGLFEAQKNESGVGISNNHNVKNGKYSLNSIIDGEHPGYDTGKLKQRLLHTGYKAEECEICGFEEQRMDDHLTPLILQFKDGDKSNHVMENLEMVCYNCSFLYYGHIPKRKIDLEY